MRRIRIIDGDDMYYRHEEKFMRDPELREAYECGRKKGWEEAMEEVEGYGERRGGSRGGYGQRGGYNQRDEDREWDEGYGERRRRDSRGRYM